MIQQKLEMPKNKRTTRVTIKLNDHDVLVLERLMVEHGETNMSSYIRRLIHDRNRARGGK